MATDYSVRDLVAPKPLKFVVNCIGGGNLTELPLGAGSQANTEASASFVVPEAGCPVLRIRLINDFMASSWSNRYRGSLTVHSVRVTKPDGAGS